jgi:predicted DNA-binding protein
MKAKNLSSVWEAPDNTRLMRKQTSVRLATHIEARLSAICEIFPAKSKSQVINDLLAAALDDFADGFEFVPSKEKEREEDFEGETFYEIDCGMRRKFLNRANEYLKQYEKELGNDEPSFFNAYRSREVEVK